jgi:hypothetical protein
VDEVREKETIFKQVNLELNFCIRYVIMLFECWKSELKVRKVAATLEKWTNCLKW